MLKDTPTFLQWGWGCAETNSKVSSDGDSGRTRSTFDQNSQFSNIIGREGQTEAPAASQHWRSGGLNYWKVPEGPMYSSSNLAEHHAFPAGFFPKRLEFKTGMSPIFPSSCFSGSQLKKKKDTKTNDFKTCKQMNRSVLDIFVFFFFFFKSPQSFCLSQASLKL